MRRRMRRPQLGGFTVVERSGGLLEAVLGAFSR
jgi:hypothetical protein